MSIQNKRIARLAAVTVACAIGLALPSAAGAGVLSDRVDSLSNAVDNLEARVQSTLLSGGSAPVSFAGEARLKMQYHDLGFNAPGYMMADRSYLQSGWEGNENLFRLGMIVMPGRNTILWSKIGFQHTLTGNRSYGDPAMNTGYTDGYFQPYQYRQDKARNSITIHEDLCAGMAVRTVPASFWVKLGNTLWTEASPLTVWKAQPRTFAWEYLPFEVEQPIARYYEYNIAKGEKSGRAAWNKKPFNGINVESINLPADLYLNFVYGTYERFDNFERGFIDFGGDLAYADGAESPFPAKGHGVGDSYRHVTHGRFAKSKMFGNMIMGLNYVGNNYKDDILYANKEGNNYSLITEFRGYDSIFVKEPKTLSLDLRGPINDNFSIHADLAVNRTDVVWFVDTVGTGRATSSNLMTQYSARLGRPEWYEERTVESGDYIPAFYTKFNYNGVLPIEADLAYISKGFYSPFSFATPMDAFFAYGANMVGAGKFIARGEGSPYTQNMMGLNLTFTPKLSGYGHLRLKYGQHMNIEEGRDLLFFPYRLNGSDMFSFFHSSFNRWGNALVDNSVKTWGRLYKGRVGDESFVHMASWFTNGNVAGTGINPVGGPGAGGLRSDYLAMFEGFVPYDNAQQAYDNFRSKHTATSFATTNSLFNNTNIIRFNDNTSWRFSNTPSSITNHALWYEQVEITERGDGTMDTSVIGSRASTNSSWVPESKKYTFNLELDAAYDIGGMVGYKKDLFVGGYAGINGVSRALTPLAFSAGKPENELKDGEKNDMLLWSLYLRLEPAIALSKNFYLLGLLGYENWRSQKSWMMVAHNADGDITGVRSPTASSIPNPIVAVTPATISANSFVRVPINYQDYAYGLGFDWDMLERVGLHGRVKWIGHIDNGLNKFYDDVTAARRDKARLAYEAGNENYADWASREYFTDMDRNDWKTPVFSLEVKMWF